MESTGVPDKIQISQETWYYLVASGKSHWCIPREDTVSAKGKGELSTFFLHMETAGRTKAKSYKNGKPPELSEFEVENEAIKKRNRMVDWTSEILSTLLSEIVARRQAVGSGSDPKQKIEKAENSLSRNGGNQTVIDEVQEIIILPEYNATAASRDLVMDDIVLLSKDVRDELHDYVRCVAGLYRDNRKLVYCN